MRHQGVLGTEPAEKRLPDLPHGPRPWSQPDGHTAPGSRSEEVSSSSSPSHLCLGDQAQSSTLGDLAKQAATSCPTPDVFLALSSSQPTPITTTISPQSRNSWGSGPMIWFQLPSFRKPRASVCCLPALCQPRVTRLGPVNTVYLPEN